MKLLIKILSRIKWINLTAIWIIFTLKLARSALFTIPSLIFSIFFWCGWDLWFWFGLLSNYRRNKAQKYYSAYFNPWNILIRSWNTALGRNKVTAFSYVKHEEVLHLCNLRSQTKMLTNKCFGVAIAGSPNISAKKVRIKFYLCKYILHCNIRYCLQAHCVIFQ